jgi:hypothetical protein
MASETPSIPPFGIAKSAKRKLGKWFSYDLCVLCGLNVYTEYNSFDDRNHYLPPVYPAVSFSSLALYAAALVFFAEPLV